MDSLRPHRRNKLNEDYSTIGKQKSGADEELRFGRKGDSIFDSIHTDHLRKMDRELFDILRCQDLEQVRARLFDLLLQEEYSIIP